ncbi:hypothetical protein [Rhodococcus sp. IEGM 1379]|uniref:hypothetical protein n=1 Tax=Rhodococcus sp. IEGM 1379 TaxID=3047086 RepID=UPI0024B7215D|nr:hypothetical protein [Rhodococcus sp. IEGM 1379]MDI9915506.1 hypothetical protein [Rhodococcus sp. IEGM 1379]
MYWTPAWGIVLASVTGIVSVLGTVGGVVLTLRHSRKESEADRMAAESRLRREILVQHATTQRDQLLAIIDKYQVLRMSYFDAHEGTATPVPYGNFVSDFVSTVTEISRAKSVITNPVLLEALEEANQSLRRSLALPSPDTDFKSVRDTSMKDNDAAFDKLIDLTRTELDVTAFLRNAD